MKNIITLMFMIPYKVVYLEIKGKEGYYLLKRKWFWYVMFIPILIYRTIVNFFLEILNIVDYVYSYDSHWIRVNNKKPDKLNFKQKKYITERLLR